MVRSFPAAPPTSERITSSPYLRQSNTSQPQFTKKNESTLPNSPQSSVAEVGGRYTATTAPVAPRFDHPDAPAKRARGGARPGLYAVILVVVILAATAYKLRRDGLFACDTSGYGSDAYVAYCQAAAYGDYDYGAFWYGLEPSANISAANADVLFVGNSRMQFGLSTGAVEQWFESHDTK